MRKETLLQAMGDPRSTPCSVSLAPNIRVTFGMPVKPDTLMQKKIALFIPSEPHLYFASEVKVCPPQQSSIPIELTLHNVLVLESHAKRDDKNMWRFSNGQEVIATATTYNKYADEHNLPHIDVIIACNRPNEETKPLLEDTTMLEEEGIIFVQEGLAYVTRSAFSQEVSIKLHTSGAFARTVEAITYGAKFRRSN